MRRALGWGPCLAGSFVLAGFGCASPPREGASIDAGANERASLNAPNALNAANVAAARVDAHAALRALRERHLGAAREMLAPGPARLALDGDRVVAEPRDHDAARPARVTLPARADGAVALSDDASRVAIAFTLRGAAAVDFASAEGLAVYSRALGSGASAADVVHRVRADGTEDFVSFVTRPAREELVYDVDVARVAGVRLVADTLELLDETGTPRLRVAPPYVLDARGARHAATLALEGCAFDADPRAPWDRAVTPPGASRCALHVRWGGECGEYGKYSECGEGGRGEIAYPALVDPAWTTTGSMATTRAGHTVVRLASNKLLVAGGNNGTVVFSSAELFDGTSAFAATGAMTALRNGHAAALLTLGKVLQLGGGSGAGTGATSLASATAETYDPSTGTFTATSPMSAPRTSATAVALPSGKVLIAGGWTGSGSPLSTAELFDGTATFAATGAMPAGRQNHQAVLLATGKVLEVGGMGTAYFATADLYNPATGTFAATGSMGRVRRWPRLALLPSGKVLVVGGDDSGGSQAMAELYDPAAGLFAVTGGMTVGRLRPEIVTLASGHVLVAGGYFGAAALSTTEIYDPTTATFAAVGGLAAARQSHRLVLLASNAAIAIGGDSGTGTVLASAERLSFAAAGATCTVKDDCLSGVCSGRCCTAACAAPTGCQAASSCDASGACVYTPKPAATACGVGYACNGTSTACPTGCATDASCDASHYCAPSGTCQPVRAKGATCNAATDCKVAGCRDCGAGTCVGGVCCESACVASCKACSKALTGVTDGTCADVRAGLADPSGTCKAAAQNTCQTDGLCDGNGACRLYGATTSCGTATCPNDTTAQGQFCSGVGACNSTGTTKTCATGYKCAAGLGCRSNCLASGDCVSGYVCVGGACVAQLDLGQPCVDAAICKSGQCVDGVCCNSACAGQCEACDAAGSVGTCAAILASPHGTRAACDAGTASAPCTAKTCDGVGRVACAYVGADVACAPASCTAGVASKAGSCASGACSVQTTNCASFACAGAACATTCTSDAECADKFRCDTAAHDCVPRQGSTCSTDGLSVVDPVGGTTSCAPYVCAGGQCRGGCGSTADCQSAYVCDLGVGKCVAAPATADSGGCSVPSGAGTPSAAGFGIAIATAIAGCVRRRARRPHPPRLPLPRARDR